MFFTTGVGRHLKAPASDWRRAKPLSPTVGCRACWALAQAASVISTACSLESSCQMVGQRWSPTINKLIILRETSVEGWFYFIMKCQEPTRMCFANDVILTIPTCLTIKWIKMANFWGLTRWAAEVKSVVATTVVAGSTSSKTCRPWTTWSLVVKRVRRNILELIYIYISWPQAKSSSTLSKLIFTLSPV